MARRSGLGKGLGALIPSEVAAADHDAALREISVSQIEPNPNQPRDHFDEEALVSLTASVTELGVLQPVLVRPLGNERYELIAGERRWRAAKRAGLQAIPAVVRTIDGGLHVAGKGAGTLFRYPDVIACQATPNGTRRLLRSDATSIELGTDAFHQGDRLRAHIDSGLDPSVVVPAPDPEGEEPVPTRGVLGKALLTTALWIALAVAVVGGLILHRLRPDLLSFGTLGVIVAVAVALAADGIWLTRRARSES